MKTEIVIHPDYEFLRSFITALPSDFSRLGEIIYQGRNEIRVIETGGMTVNVKQFGIPNVVNRFVYMGLRKPKAQRAYEHAILLQERNIPTPTPIAYIIIKNGGTLKNTYFISEQVAYSRRMYEFGSLPVEGNEGIVRAFSRFTADLHFKEVYHKDYSAGNILFDIIDGKPEFCIVDINRMKFGPVSLKKGCANFARLWGQQPFFRLLAEEYALCRKADVASCIKWVLIYRRKFWKQFIRKHTPSFKLDL